jgi:hypothetical protein
MINEYSLIHLVHTALALANLPMYTPGHSGYRLLPEIGMAGYPPCLCIEHRGNHEEAAVNAYAIALRRHPAFRGVSVSIEHRNFDHWHVLVIPSL